MQGPIYKAVEWLDHQGMDLIEQVNLYIMLAETFLEQGDPNLKNQGDTRSWLSPIKTVASTMVAGRAPGFHRLLEAVWKHHLRAAPHWCLPAGCFQSQQQSQM